MKGIWRKCLGLSLGFPLFAAAAGEPVSLSTADRSPPIIARSMPVAGSVPTAAAAARPTVSLGCPRAVTLERPRVAAAAPATTIQLTSFHTETADDRPPVTRAQMDDRQPLPPGPGGPFAADQAATGPFAAPYPAYGVPPGLGGPPPADDSGWDTHNRFGLGDGVMNTYNNRFYFNSEYLLWWIRGNRLPPLVNASGPGQMALMPGLGTETLDGGSSVGATPIPATASVPATGSTATTPLALRGRTSSSARRRATSPSVPPARRFWACHSPTRSIGRRVT